MNVQLLGRIILIQQDVILRRSQMYFKAYTVFTKGVTSWFFLAVCISGYNRNMCI